MMKHCRLCDKCGTETATVHITEIVEGVRAAERHLCERCAEEGRIRALDVGEKTSVIVTRRDKAPGKLICERCKQRPATVHVSKVAGGAPSEERHLCEQCAAKTQYAQIVTRVTDLFSADLVAQARDAIITSAEIKRCFAQRASADVARAAELVAECIRGGGKILLCGNGGSAAEAQHIAGELVGRFKLERPAFHAVALTTNTSILTAIANDYSFDDVFARQVGGLGRADDVLLAYSTSGSSKNIIRAIQAAKIVGMKAVGLTGASGGAMAKLCDVCIKSPSDDTPTVQECHTAAGHTICLLVEKLIYEREEKPPEAPAPE